MEFKQDRAAHAGREGSAGGYDEPDAARLPADGRAWRIAQRLPQPKVYIIDTPQPNAFATGRNPQNAVIAATSGLLNVLTREETAGVMRELAHVQNRDTLTMTVTASCWWRHRHAGELRAVLRAARFNGRSNPILGIAIMIPAPLTAGLVQMAISRSREYEADARGAEICGNPLWLASALEKIERGARAQINPYAERAPAMAHMYISNPLNGRGPDNLFSTHPSTANRVEALRRMAGEMGVSSIRPTETPRRTAGPWG